MLWFLKVLNQYSDFDGRARRKEYWMFVLFNMVFGIAASILDTVLGLTWGALGYGLIQAVYGLAMLIPGLAVCVRRLHDTGRSGWILLVVFIPIIGTIWILILLLKEGNSFENEYGPNPKQVNFY